MRALVQCPSQCSVPQCPGPLPASLGSSVSRVPTARSSVISRELWFSRVRSPGRARALVHLGQLSPGPACPCALPCPAIEFFQITVMVRTRGGSRLRPRVRFNTLEREEQASVPAPVPEPVPEAVPGEPQEFRRYQTRMGPRALHQCHRGDPGGPGPPSWPILLDRGSHHRLGLSHHSPRQQQRRPHRLSYRLPRGSGGPYSSGILSWGM